MHVKLNYFHFNFLLFASWVMRLTSKKNVSWLLMTSRVTTTKWIRTQLWIPSWTFLFHSTNSAIQLDLIDDPNNNKTELLKWEQRSWMRSYSLYLISISLNWPIWKTVSFSVLLVHARKVSKYACNSLEHQ